MMKNVVNIKIKIFLFYIFVISIIFLNTYCGKIKYIYCKQFSENNWVYSNCLENKNIQNLNTYYQIFFDISESDIPIRCEYYKGKYVKNVWYRTVDNVLNRYDEYNDIGKIIYKRLSYNNFIYNEIDYDPVNGSKISEDFYVLTDDFKMDERLCFIRENLQQYSCYYTRNFGDHYLEEIYDSTGNLIDNIYH